MWLGEPEHEVGSQSSPLPPASTIRQGPGRRAPDDPEHGWARNHRRAQRSPAATMVDPR